MGKMFEARFFCMNCGKEGIPLWRKHGSKKACFHRKKLYCPNCKMMVNHVECHQDFDVQRFHEDFSNGLYVEEAQQSIQYLNDHNLKRKV